MKKSLFTFPLIALILFSQTPLAFSQEIHSPFKTDYTVIYYTQCDELNDFLWKIGNIAPSCGSDVCLVKTRVDRIVERVEDILGIYPENFKVDIYLKTGYKEGEIALYSETTRTITIFVERVTDGVLAHEMAHALIHAYFKTSPSRNVQEILCQYVDAYLWKDY
ncbi:MAG: hypothetical protein JW800_04350 [Candidatus Omnitrophica bacterium]|nr:hypothetical protein [Candidatus Omnitrophota bacterium]